MSADEKAPLLGVRYLKKQYGSKVILDIDELDLYAGEAVLLTGRNGAGKSTLMKILAGLERGNEGSLLYQGGIIDAPWYRLRRASKPLRHQVIYLHQHPFLFDTSVKENLAYGLKCRNVAKTQQNLIVQQALHWSGLEHLAERNAKTLSGGEMQRIALARAWVLEPELLLLDEPTANMDRESREQTSFLIRRLIHQGTAVVICSHEIKPDNRLINRVLHLQDCQLSDSRKPLTDTVKIPEPMPLNPGVYASRQPSR